MKHLFKFDIFILFFLLVVAFSSIPSFDVRADGLFVEDQDIFSYDAEEKVWQEQDVRLPEYPVEENLRQMKLVNSQFKYYIDVTSVAVGDLDAVVRYSVVIVSSSGVRNVLREGIRCDERLSKTYAYGTGSGPFREMTSTWKLLSKSGSYRYRYELYKNYFCREGSVPEKAQDIIEELRDTL